MALKGGSSRWLTSNQEQQPVSPPVRHSKFIPEAERGWKSAAGSGEKERSSSHSGGDSSSNSRRSSNFLSFASLWQTPRDKLKSLQSAHNDQVIDDGDEEEGSSVMRGHGRERSNSMPASPTLEDNRSFFSASQDLERSLSGTSSIKRKSLQLPPNSQMLSSNDEDVGEDELQVPLPPPISPSAFARHNTRSPSISEQRESTTSSQNPSRGYAWRREVEGTNKKPSSASASGGGGFIHPSHRNPTGKQAFYDTHFGSSSGWRSVAGMADEVFHPFESATHTLGRWSGIRKERRGKGEEADIESSKRSTFIERKKETLLSWNALNNLGIFGMSNSAGGQAPTVSSSSSSPNNNNRRDYRDEAGQIEDLRTYEPELIPTIQRDPHANQYFKSLEGNVVIMGGYRGSILRDAETHQMMWVPLKVGVGLRRPTLELELTTDAEDQSEDLVIADEMLGGIGSMVDMGKRLINRCSTKRTKVYSWGYDWRLSLAKSSAKLEEYLVELWMKSSDREQDRKGAKVIAHSMGGLVALSALARTKRPEIFDSLIFASTPFLGTANILGPFRFGDAALFNDEICSPRATFSFRSSFYLLPVDPSDEKGGQDTRGGRCFEEEDGTPHDLDFLDAETWNDLGFSPCVELGMRREVLEKSRKRAKKQGYTLGERLERSASIRETTQTTTAGIEDDDRRGGQSRRTAAKAEVPALPGNILSMDHKMQHDSSGSVLDMAGEGLLEATRLGQNVLSDNVQSDEKETLQPVNRQGEDPNAVRRQASPLSDAEWQEILEDEASAAWLYLERTLAETRQFFNDLRTGFKEEYFKANRYPAIAILTSGRTPTVRGALVAIKDSSTSSSTSTNNDDWKEGVRKGDYSRMLYAPGDGVILRRSSTTLPGRWGELLVRGKEDDKDALTNHEGVVETSHRHVTLLSDVDGVGRCLEACRRANLKRAK